MPTLRLFTNVPVNAAQGSDLIKALSKEVATLTGKPESYVLVHLQPNQMMSFGGSEEPLAYVELISLGILGLNKNKEISRAISDILKAKLGIAQQRYYLKIEDPVRDTFGYNASTFG